MPCQAPVRSSAVMGPTRRVFPAEAPCCGAWATATPCSKACKAAPHRGKGARTWGAWPALRGSTRTVAARRHVDQALRNSCSSHASPPGVVSPRSCRPGSETNATPSSLAFAEGDSAARHSSSGAGMEARVASAQAGGPCTRANACTDARPRWGGVAAVPRRLMASRSSATPRGVPCAVVRACASLAAGSNAGKPAHSPAQPRCPPHSAATLCELASRVAEGWAPVVFNMNAHASGMLCPSPHSPVGVTSPSASGAPAATLAAMWPAKEEAPAKPCRACHVTDAP